jgi:hypothetical protein
LRFLNIKNALEVKICNFSLEKKIARKFSEILSRFGKKALSCQNVASKKSFFCSKNTLVWECLFGPFLFKSKWAPRAVNVTYKKNNFVCWKQKYLSFHMSFDIMEL